MKAILSRILKWLYGSSVTAKVLQGTDSRLYYERAQHLLFAFKSTLAYEPIIQRKVSKYIKPADLIFDIGGNIGQYALLFSYLTGPNGKVITIEPDFKNFSFLQFNIAVNKITNTLCLKKGLGRSSTRMEFFRDTETGGRKGSFNREYVEENYRGHKEIVETATLDSLIEQYGVPSFVKIDVEGFETEVIAGLTKSLQNTVFFIEVREDTKEAIYNYFNQKGFQCFHIDSETDILISKHEEIPGFANLLFRKA